ncbi:hypothetical protein KV701_20195 [Limnobaculum sp. M2-1]|uniref:hypothetical protein n=1 Tax=Limnobaculum sp. M2-1 TaxID=2855838 RepID=UPI001C47E5BC|nr:hypothetical protein [Limnobaculum sp. M2-1]MBV7694041.1 hypothetical protein [Limnobaculum sp. M2-1]
MMKTNMELIADINSTPIGALSYASKESKFFGGSAAFYDTCRQALSYEEKGWYCRAMGIWGIAFSFHDNAYSQGYALYRKEACAKALKAISATRKTDESEGVTGVRVELDLDELEAQWD